ncbi:MAG: hypothetical protein QOF98_3170, partial [Streptomyces sp.]|nr:hypothetical protein [Streptomyces sp.]
VATALWTEGAPVAPGLPPTRSAESPVATVPTGSTSPRPARPPVRLDLGGSLISLDGQTLADLRAELAAARPTAAPANTAARTGVPVPAGLAEPIHVPAHATSALAAGAPSALDTLAGRFPVAAELSALVRETMDVAAELITAGSRRTGPGGPGRPVRPQSRPPAPPVVPPVAAAGAATAGVSPNPPAKPKPWQAVVRVSPETMPYLLDHCFFPQRAGWPEVGDRWPVVPATTIVQHMMDAAEEAAPGLRAVAVHGARFDQWMTATPPVDVPVTAVAEGPGRLAVSFGPRARGTVELAAAYPEAPEVNKLPDPGTEREPAHKAAQIYDERWMFHGPAFQGVSELIAIGDAHVRAVLTTPPAPGALLDNVGQVLGYWIMATRTERTVVFPVQMREMRFYGPHPHPGTKVECVVRITTLTDTLLEADVQLVVNGRVWADLTGWQDRRFDNDPQTRPVERFPERNTLSHARPGGWSLLYERWPDLASRDLIMRNALGSGERSAYETHTPRGRRQWLLGRIAAKDAVRQWLWDHGEGPVFPAEIRIGNDELGRPYATGLHGRTLPELDLSLAHCAESAVAIVRPHVPGPGPGIDLEEVTERDEATLATALHPDELTLLRASCAATGESEALWFTRFWAAKEAVAKAEGTGFRGRPRDFAVLEAAPDRLLVAGRLERAYPVHCERVGNPPGLPVRDYVVAWTTGPATAPATAPANGAPHGNAKHNDANDTPHHEEMDL